MGLKVSTLLFVIVVTLFLTKCFVIAGDHVSTFTSTSHRHHRHSREVDSSQKDEKIGRSSPVANFDHVDKFLFELLQQRSKETVLDTVTKRVEWLNFLNTTFYGLSRAAIQKNRKLYNVANIEDWGQPIRLLEGILLPPHGIRIDKNNLKEFLDKLCLLLKIDVPIHNLLDYALNSSSSSSFATAEHQKQFQGEDSAKNKTEVILNQLNRVLRVTLRDELTCSFDPSENVLTARGHFVFLSHVKESSCLHPKSKSKGNYNDYHSHTGPGTGSITVQSIQKLVIFALNTFFIDTNLDGEEIGGENQRNISLFVFAPHWEIVGRNPDPENRYVINLNGVDAQPSREQMRKAGKDSKGNGQDGANGEVGQNGGNFVGFGFTLKGNPGLENFPLILADGGSGSAGQEGGDGADGEAGSSIKPNSSIYTMKNASLSQIKIGLSELPCSCNNLNGVTKKCLEVGVNKSGSCITFTCYGPKGSPGKSGGRGGRGGLGGIAGKIILPRFSNISSPMQGYTTANGLPGEDAAGGMAGIGGKNGDNINITFRIHEQKRDGETLCLYSFEKSQFIPTTHTYSAPTGQNGCAHCQERPSAPSPPSPPFYLTYMANYLSYANESGLPNMFLKQRLSSFIETLSNATILPNI